MRRRHARIPRTLPALNLTPLIDTALTLLVIFMVTTPLVQHAIKVDLPQGQMNEVQPAQIDECVIYIDSEGNYYLDKKCLALEEIIVALEDRAVKNPDMVVFVNGDKDAAYQSIYQVVEKIKYLGGIKYVALSSEEAH